MTDFSNDEELFQSSESFQTDNYMNSDIQCLHLNMRDNVDCNIIPFVQ